MSRPRVWVALATYNGLAYLEPQVRSILSQQGADVELVVSDDGSTDGTREWVAQLAQRDPRVHLLPRRNGTPGVGSNFLHLADNINPEPGQYVAFSDQDDLWHAGKLREQIAYLEQNSASATSSNVLSFSPGGERHVIVKSQPQKRWDYIFEAPGPGSTFLLTDEAFALVREGLSRTDRERAWLHDWLIYALVRAAGAKWVIDPRPHVAYRQHEGNILGEHRGWGAIADRWRNLRSGRYRDQFALVARAARQQGEAHGRGDAWLAELDRLIEVLEADGAPGHLGLVPFIPQMRRKPSEALALGTLGAVGVW